MFTAAAAVAGTSRSRVYVLRKNDPAFAIAWEEAEEMAADALEAEARRRAVEGTQEPLVSAGRIVRDDDGRPIAVRRYSDNLLLALIKARRPPRAKGRCASNCRYFGQLLMRPAHWQRSLPGCRWRRDAGRGSRIVEASGSLRQRS